MAATDSFSSNSSGLQSPPRKAFAITPSDVGELTFVTRGIFVGTTGNLAVILADDSSAVTLKNIPSGTLLPLRVKQVNSTNTTATDLVGVY